MILSGTSGGPEALHQLHQTVNKLFEAGELGVRSVFPGGGDAYRASIYDAAVYQGGGDGGLAPLRYPVRAAHYTTGAPDWAPPGQDLTLSRDLWVSVEPALRDACRAVPAGQRERRLAELLGLKPAGPTPAPGWVVRLTVAAPQSVGPAGLAVFRPCADPEPAATRCGTTLKGPDSYAAWLGRLAVSSYRVDDSLTLTGYPWTRRGTTYDWGEAAAPDHRGVQEYVVAAGARVRIEAVEPL